MVRRLDFDISFIYLRLSRYAQNASGQSGAVPATYVEILSEQNLLNINEESNSQSQSVDYTVYQTSYEEEQREPVDTYIPPPPAPLLSTDVNTYDPLVFNNSQQQQQYSLLGDVRNSYNIETTYDTPSSFSVSTPNAEPEITKSTEENSTTTKTKDKSKLFTLSRSKSKDKLRNSVENGLEVRKKMSHFLIFCFLFFSFF